MLKQRFEAACGLLAAVALFAIMALTFLDVGGRKILSNSIPGSLEVTELLMVAVIFSALPLVSIRGEHVVFTSLDRLVPVALRRVQAALVHLVCAAVLVGLGWLMWRTGTEFAEAGEITQRLRIPKYPFIYAMGVLCALSGAVHAALAWLAARGHNVDGGHP